MINGADARTAACIVSGYPDSVNREPQGPRDNSVASLMHSGRTGKISAIGWVSY